MPRPSPSGTPPLAGEARSTRGRLRAWDKRRCSTFPGQSGDPQVGREQTGQKAMLGPRVFWKSSSLKHPWRGGGVISAHRRTGDREAAVPATRANMSQSWHEAGGGSSKPHQQPNAAGNTPSRACPSRPPTAALAPGLLPPACARLRARLQAAPTAAPPRRRRHLGARWGLCQHPRRHQCPAQPPRWGSGWIWGADGGAEHPLPKQSGIFPGIYSSPGLLRGGCRALRRHELCAPQSRGSN